MQLSDVIKIDNKFARSVNLERDKTELDILSTYKVTEKAQEVLERFVSAMEGEKVSAWSLVGPYGMGKSAFLNFFLSLTGPVSSSNSQEALKKLESTNKDLHGRFVEGKNRLTNKQGFFQIPVVAAFESINTTLARGLRTAVADSKITNKGKIYAHLNEYNRTFEVTSLLEAFRNVAESSKTPIVLIVDELGKNLEYLSYHSHNGDLFILQQLAEMEDIYLFVCLHQAFDEYLSGFSAVQQQEWNKVQGRFEELSFIESTTQMLKLIQSIVRQTDTGTLHHRIIEWASAIEVALKDIDIVGEENFDLQVISGIYPIHPITGLALIELCRKFAQNERTLVSFLASGHIYALPELMDKIAIDQEGILPAIGLDRIYDYFFQLSHTSLAGRPEAQRWLEIQDIIHSSNHLSNEEIIVLKNIGILNLLAGNLGLKASQGVISLVMEYSYCWPHTEVEKLLDSLSMRGIIFFREYANEYRLWEGSDFDITGAVRKEKSRLSIGSLEDLLETYLPLSPVIAARHAIQKGIIRRFERRWLDAETLSDKLTPNLNYDGLLVYCYGVVKEPLDVPKDCQDGRPLIVAYVPAKENLSELVLELLACQRVKSYPQLAHDRVARKEVNYRIQLARAKFREYLAKAFTPGAPGLIWYVKGEKKIIRKRRKLSEAISGLCDEYYQYAPTIPNEIVSGEKLSGIAVRARRELIEAMATSADLENLSLTGWGPEIAMYRSLILAKGLHKQDLSTGGWYLTLDSSDPALIQLWEALDKSVENADYSGCTVEDLLNRLRERPFGLRQGPALIYISHFLLVKSETLAVFREGVYHPYLTAADMALLLKRPELFTVKQFISDEVQEKVFCAYREVLKKYQLNIDSNLRNTTMLGVVGPLMKYVDQLPRYSKQTHLISKNAQRIRSAIINAVDPIMFLFEEVPEALRIKMDSADVDHWTHEIEKNLKEVLDELGSAYEKLNNNVQAATLEAFGCANLDELYALYRNSAQSLIAVCENNELKALLKALARGNPSSEDWIRGIAGTIVKKPLDAWNDNDFDIFNIKLREYVDRLKQLEALANAGQGNDTHVISMMGPGGIYQRDILTIDRSDPLVNKAFEALSRLPDEKRRSVLALLAKELILGG